MIIMVTIITVITLLLLLFGSFLCSGELCRFLGAPGRRFDGRARHLEGFTAFKGYIGLYWVYIGIMENKMETTI